MSKISKAVSQMNENNRLRKDEVVTNFMGGDSYKLNPIDTLRMIAASSIFGEASYYRKSVTDGRFKSAEDKFSDKFYSENFMKYDGMTTTEIFEKTIDDALSFNFEETLKLAVELRNSYHMRLNPQIIMVRAAIHPGRIEFSKNNPGKFHKYNESVMCRADEPMSQLTYYLYLNEGKKNNIPSILKRSISKKLSGFSVYMINKYKNHEIGMINAVRITHANSKPLDCLMKTGSVASLMTDNKEMTWEQKRSSGMTWKEIVTSTDIGHMALLRNLRNIFEEVEDTSFCYDYMTKLKDGVFKGKQFPFRYYLAYKVIESSPVVNHKQIILDALEECIDISVNHLPKLKGKTMCLSDNSGSAWGGVPTEYGTVTVAEIDNLSSVIAAVCSDEGEVGKFGDTIKTFSISKRQGILNQCKEITKNKGSDVGYNTEGGIWEFFRDSINNKVHYDNIFIFSDQQAGTGGLYGTVLHQEEYEDYVCDHYYANRYINIYKLVLDYRRLVNPKVNVFSIQTAGYNNVLIPNMSYRCAMLTGWTGKEIQFASEYIKQWNEIEEKYKMI